MQSLSVSKRMFKSEETCCISCHVLLETPELPSDVDKISNRLCTYGGIPVAAEAF